MISTILTLVAETAVDDLDLTEPSTLFASYNEGDTSDRKLRRALERTCRYLRDDFDWSHLKARHTFTADGTATSYALPSDFARMIGDTVWDLTMQRQLCRAETEAEWALVQSSPIVRIDPSWQIRGGALAMYPAPEAQRQYGYNYLRDAIGKTAAGAYLAKFTADTDVALWDDELVRLGIVYHYRKSERYDYAQDEMDFKKACYDHQKRDGGGGRMLDMGASAASSQELVDRLKSNTVIGTADTISISIPHTG